MKTSLFGLCIAGLSMLSGSLAFGQTDSISFLDESIDNIVYSQVGEDKAIMGLGLAIVHNGNIVYSRGYGWEDWDAKVPVDPEQTRFRWASVSKTLTAVAGVIADSEGMVDLDTNIESYYPKYKVPNQEMVGPNVWNLAFIPESDRVITMRQLLSHTSGIQHYTNGLAIPTPLPIYSENPDVNDGMEWALANWAGSPLLSIPGRERSYSTPAFNLAGVVMEKKMGLSFEDIVRTFIAQPAGMDTLRADTLWDAAPRRAVGYFRDQDDNWVTEIDNDVSWKLASGGFVSTVNDMGRYAAALLNRDILSSSELTTMWEDQTFNDGSTITRGGGRQGLGWMKNNSGTRFFHDGAQLKGQCMLMILPTVDTNVSSQKDTLAIAIMTNASYNALLDIDLEVGQIMSFTGVNLNSISSGIENLIRQRLIAGDEPIDAEDRSRMIPNETEYFLNPTMPWYLSELTQTTQSTTKSTATKPRTTSSENTSTKGTVEPTKKGSTSGR